MKALRLTLSLILIPRLFATLFLLPLLLSILVVYAQLVATGVILQSVDTRPQAVSRTMHTVKHNNLGRRLLYGTDEPLPSVKICRWKSVYQDGKLIGEVPENEECKPDRLDAALIVSDPQTYDPAEYAQYFSGNVLRLHLCKSCHPDIVVFVEEAPLRSDVKSVWGWLIIHLVLLNDDVRDRYLQVANDYHDIKQHFGNMYFSPKGFLMPARISGIENTLAVVFNVASLVVISLWLALKAHRKVLDYFARSGALLPMVAATGKHAFYQAIWVLTLLRVGAFLFAAIPMTYSVLSDFVEKDGLEFFPHDPLGFFIWMFAIVASLALATLIASIADLKHRHSILSFMYKYVPVVVCSIGALFWCATFLVDNEVLGWVRNLTAALPIIGIAPVIVAPVFKPNGFILLSHGILTVLILTYALRQNARWFAAHLEDL